MPQYSEVLVNISARTAEEGVVCVPEACYVRCEKLLELIGEAAISQLDDTYDAVVCDSQSRLPSPLRHCAALRIHFKRAGSPVTPFKIGESNPRSIADVVDEAIAANGALDLVQAAERAGFSRSPRLRTLQ